MLCRDDNYSYYPISAVQANNCEVFDAQWEILDDFKKQIAISGLSYCQLKKMNGENEPVTVHIL